MSVLWLTASVNWLLSNGNIEMITAAGAWDAKSFLTNLFTSLGDLITLVIMVVGLVAMFVGVWRIVTGLISHGQKPTNWFVNIALLLVGGIMASTTGWSFIQDLSSGGRKTIEDLGGNAITIISIFFN